MRLCWLIGLLPLLAAPEALACRCTSPTDPGVAYARAAAVVRGRVVQLKPVPARRGAHVQLEISGTWKRPFPARLQVSSLDLCSYRFEKGKEYVVFLVQDGKSWVTTRCMGNQPLGAAGETLQWLQENGTSSRP